MAGLPEDRALCMCGLEWRLELRVSITTDREMNE